MRKQLSYLCSTDPSLVHGMFCSEVCLITFLNKMHEDDSKFKVRLHE
jgi:hypothetical protein